MPDPFSLVIGHGNVVGPAVWVLSTGVDDLTESTQDFPEFDKALQFAADSCELSASETEILRNKRYIAFPESHGTDWIRIRGMQWIGV